MARNNGVVVKATDYLPSPSTEVVRSVDRVPTCEHIKQDGQQCAARPMTSSVYCFFHNPAAASQRTAARKAGGQKHRAAALPGTAPDRTLKTVADVTTLLAETINQVRRGEMDPRVANSVGYLAGLLLKAIDQGEIHERLAALEASVHRSRRHADYAFDAEPEGLFLADGSER